MALLFSKIGYVFWCVGPLPVDGFFSNPLNIIQKIKDLNRIIQRTSKPGVMYQNYTRIFNTKHLDGMPESILQNVTSKFLPTQNVTSFHDKDDTTLCSGGKIPYGQDERCAGHHSVYAGFVNFTRALNRYTNSDSDDGRKFIQVSARPRELDLVKSSSKAPGKELGEILDPKLESGKLEASLDAVANEKLFRHENYELVGLEKADDMDRRIKELKSSDNATDVYVFNGDDGQGDAYAAGWSRDRNITDVSFIHLVGGSPYGSEDTRKGGSSDDIVFYLNYAHLANLTATIGLISKEQAKDVYRSILQSAFGKSCCNDAKCQDYTNENEEDGTCGEVLDTEFKFDSEACHSARHAVYNMIQTGEEKNAIYGMCPKAKDAQVCQCIGIVDNEGYGKCSKKDENRSLGCYVKSPLFTTCGDAKQTTREGFENQKWSTEACSRQGGQGEKCFTHEMCSEDYYCSKNKSKGTNETCQPRKELHRYCQSDKRKCKLGLKCRLRSDKFWINTTCEY